MKYLTYVFYLEAAISLLSGFQSFFMPATFLKQFTADPAPTLAIEMTRWYGVLLFAMVYLLVQGLRIRGARSNLYYKDYCSVIFSKSPPHSLQPDLWADGHLCFICL